MATATRTPEAPARPANAPDEPASPPAGPTGATRFVMEGVSFATYRALRGDIDRAGGRTRLTFDRGTLELMTVSFEHEQSSRLLFLLIAAVATGLEVDFEVGGSTTFSREDLDRGLEPDECFYVANEPRVRGRGAIDLAIDPPPDLAVEIDVSRSSLDKLAIYAALGVPEFWRLEEGALQFLSLGPDAVYRPIEVSSSFPPLRRDEAEDWLRRRGSMRLKDWLRDLNAWVRDELAPRRGDQAGR